MSSQPSSPSSEESLAAVLDKVKKNPTEETDNTPVSRQEENLSGFSSYEATPEPPTPEPKVMLEEEIQAPPRAQQHGEHIGKSGRRRRSSSQHGTRTRRENAASMLKIAIYGILAVIALLAVVIVLMIVRQSTLQQEERKRQYQQIAEQQAKAQQELRENYIATRAKAPSEKESKTDAAHREHKQQNGIPTFLGDSSYSDSDKSQTPSLYDPSIFGLPSDTKSDEINKD